MLDTRLHIGVSERTGEAMSVEELERARDGVIFADSSWDGTRARNAEHLLRRMIRHLPWVVHTERDLVIYLWSAMRARYFSQNMYRPDLHLVNAADVPNKQCRRCRNG